MDKVKTRYGDLTPYSGASDYRKKFRFAVDHYDDGALKSVYLEETQVLSFPAGDFQTELITFYEDGNAKRIFPLYGQISAYWSIEEEVETAPYYDFRKDKGRYDLAVRRDKRDDSGRPCPHKARI